MLLDGYKIATGILYHSEKTLFWQVSYIVDSVMPSSSFPAHSLLVKKNVSHNRWPQHEDALLPANAPLLTTPITLLLL